ncbi:MAG: helix-turn-helix domain-containing protein [Betaproteobacteria bacterium]|nr:helix-turn-helix domain-containing protein [Betaproteobacteria bacterium]
MTETSLPETSLAQVNEGYLLDVNEVAQLLGVTRTRVSQLTSTGQLSFERRRVGARNRLYYRRSEVLAHQQTFYGRHISSTSAGADRTAHDREELSENLSDAQGAHSVRAGAMAQPAQRSASLWPENLLVEMSRLLAREQSNTDLLLKIRELSLQIQAHISAPERKTLPSAADVQARADHLEQFRSLAETLGLLRAQVQHQDHQVSLLFLEFAELKKVLLQLRQDSLKFSAARSFSSAAANNQSLLGQEELPKASELVSRNAASRKRSYPRVARMNMRKTFFSR